MRERAGLIPKDADLLSPITDYILQAYLADSVRPDGKSAHISLVDLM